MTGIDTNVLVRYITRDHPEQHAAAKRHLESNCTQETPGYVNVIILCELAWVLTTAYDASQKNSPGSSISCSGPASCRYSAGIRCAR